jgi:parallel beta-helix repeat protein
LISTEFASIIGCEIYHNARNGIFFESSDFAYIFDNHIYDNSDHGIDGMFSNNGTIIENNIHGNGFWPIIMNELCGIYLGLTVNFTIADNMIWNNTPAGITLWDSSHITVSNNDIFNNTHTGIFGMTAAFGTESMFRDNRIYGNGFSETLPLYLAGIYLEGYTYTTIQNNHVYNNTRDGISSKGENNFIIGNIVHDNNNTGIYVWECYDNIVRENIVFENEHGIELVTIGTNLTRNIVYDNDVGVFADYIGYCYMYENDIGWNNINAIELSAEAETYWHNNESIGNWWSDYSGVGVYNITDGMLVVNQDLYPSKSLDLNQSAPIDFEILETGNVIVWEASALNPSHYEVYIDSELVLTETWDGGDIEFLADGLSHGLHTIELEVYHISGHSMGNSTTADVEDLTPPDLDGPTHIEISVGDTVSAQYSAEDPSGIGSWAVNDTVNFAIDSLGALTSITDLTAGEYVIRITVTDTHGHSTFLDVTITVNAVGLPTTMILAIGGGAIAILVIVVILSKKK